MHLFSWIFCIVSLSVLRVTVSYHVMCVFTNWSQYRAEPAKFNPSHIDPLLCTHIIYAYAKLQGHQLAPVEWNDKAMYKSVAALKTSNPGLKTILAVGGWGMGSKDFSLMAAYRSTRRVFVDSAIKYLRLHDFDGLAIDWQYPTIRGGRKQDKKTFSLLLKLCDQYPDAKRVWNGASLVPYWISGNQWIAGEDAESLKNKVNWLRLSKYGGFTVWSLDMDDFNGQLCGKGPYPLLTALKERLEGPTQVWTTPRLPPTTAEMMSTMPSTIFLIDEMTSTIETVATTKPTKAVTKEIKKVINSSSLFKETTSKIGMTNTSTPQLRIPVKNTGQLTDRPGPKTQVTSTERKDFIKPWLETGNSNITNENTVKNETATESIQKKVTVKRSIQSPLPSVTKAVLRWFDLRDLGFGFMH
ncbi:hypothetical protein ACJMK2_034490 [Sinanodonta woodiana]|uniref:GH18 domain-containing protein n=1 Tax=Sinanodonta woodiana TaxID=1069815 RepID=A0ABD3WTJ1_SINWO